MKTTKGNDMNNLTQIRLSRTAAIEIGKRLAVCCHACKTTDERGGVLSARDHLCDILPYEAYSGVRKAFDDTLAELEPLPCSHTFPTHPNEDPDVCTTCGYDRTDEH